MPDILAELEALDAHYRKNGGTLSGVIERCGAQLYGFPPMPAEDRPAPAPEGPGDATTLPTDPPGQRVSQGWGQYQPAPPR